MRNNVVDIQFSGECFPGYEKDKVQQALAALMGLTPEQTQRVFNGRPIILNRGMTPEKAQRYCQRLAAIGMNVALIDETVTEKSATPATPVHAEKNPQRVLLAAPPVQSQSKQGFKSTKQLVVSSAEDKAPAPAFWGFSFNGRIGRFRYFLFHWLLLAIFLAFVAVAIAISGSFLLVGAAVRGSGSFSIEQLITLLATLGITLLIVLPVGLIFLIFGLRLTILRLHDMNLSGLWCFYYFAVSFAVALLERLFLSTNGNDLSSPRNWLQLGCALALTFFPGTKGANKYGLPVSSA